MYHRGEQLRIRKSLKLYIVLYRNTMKNIKISLNKIWYTYTALIPKILCFLYSINAKFDSNVLVEQMIKILGKDSRFIVKCPYCFFSLIKNDKEIPISEIFVSRYTIRLHNHQLGIEFYLFVSHRSMNDRGSTYKFRNARSAFRNLHVDPLSFIPPRETNK